MNYLALYFTPSAIRDHFDGDTSDIAEKVAIATDTQLEELGEWCLTSDTLYREFHRLLEAGAVELLGAEG